MNNANSNIRKAIIEASRNLDHAQSQGGHKPGFTYVPPTHARALDLDATLVEGMRGAGKSFWWSSLSSPQHRAFINAGFPETQLSENLIVTQGFGAGSTGPSYPDAEQLIGLQGEFRARSIWRAVVAFNASFEGPFAKLSSWQERVHWVESNSEAFARELDATDNRLQNESSKLLVLFDALDRLADDWQHIRILAKGLLQVALDMRSTRNLRCKIYIRPDMLEDDEIVSFQDFSKLNATKASLRWRRADLYALLYQCLGNASVGSEDFHKILFECSGTSATFKVQAPWVLPTPFRVDEDLQERVFQRLAGRAMGSSTKRGKPYTWLVNHLQDGRDQVSPRSFFAALKTAAEEESVHDEFPLSYKGIQHGVQQASNIRVIEIAEDYPWVKSVMSPLRGRLTVPCTVAEIKAIWKNDETLQNLKASLLRQGNAAKLPPQHVEQGELGIITDLEGLGMLERLEKERIQMPDVYRVAFGLGRRGGVKPLK